MRAPEGLALASAPLQRQQCATLANISSMIPLHIYTDMISMCIHNKVAAVFMAYLDVILSVDRAATMLAQHSMALTKLHSENKYFKKLFVVLRTDLTKRQFRLFTNLHHDVVISASF